MKHLTVHNLKADNFFSLHCFFFIVLWQSSHAFGSRWSLFIFLESSKMHVWYRHRTCNRVTFIQAYPNKLYKKTYHTCHMSRDMTKPTKWVCAQRRLRSVWASAQSDQSLHCQHEESLGPKLPIKRTAKTLIRMGGCPGWSESSLSAQSLCWFCDVAAQLWPL